MPTMTTYPKEGDICSLCRFYWEHQTMPPKRMVAAPSQTKNQGLPIVVCPWCDGSILDHVADNEDQ